MKPQRATTTAIDRWAAPGREKFLTGRLQPAGAHPGAHCGALALEEPVQITQRDGVPISDVLRGESGFAEPGPDRRGDPLPQGRLGLSADAFEGDSGEDVRDGTGELFAPVQAGPGDLVDESVEHGQQQDRRSPVGVVDHGGCESVQLPFLQAQQGAGQHEDPRPVPRGEHDPEPGRRGRPGRRGGVRQCGRPGEAGQCPPSAGGPGCGCAAAATNRAPRRIVPGPNSSVAIWRAPSRSAVSSPVHRWSCSMMTSTSTKVCEKARCQAASRSPSAGSRVAADACGAWPVSMPPRPPAHGPASPSATARRSCGRPCRTRQRWRTPEGCYIASSCLRKIVRIRSDAATGVFEDLEELSADCALEAPLGVPRGLALGDSAGGVRLRGRVEPYPD